MAKENGFSLALRYGHALVQSLLRLFAAGAVLFEAHQLFLRYYAREWGGIQFAGVNDCAGEDLVANGDLFEGQTFCNKPENFVPWIEVYRHHPRAALVYYGAILAVILLIGWIWSRLQRSRASTTPFGAAPKPVQPSKPQSAKRPKLSKGPQQPPPSDSEHLR